MKCLCLILVCLFGVDAITNKKARKVSVREAPIGGPDAGYRYPVPTTGGVTSSVLPQSSYSTIIDGGGTVGGNSYSRPSIDLTTSSEHFSEVPPPMVDIENLAATLDASVQNSALTVSPGASFGGNSYSSGLNQFSAVQESVAPEEYPIIFKYKPHLDGKDLNNFPHILPPSGQSIDELQHDADEQLRMIVANTQQNQIDTMEKIKKLKSSFGYGTFGYDGFTDNTFNVMGEIDLGTHQGIDLGTSIDYNALKGSDGKLKLPVQNVYHKKTIGIHIPQPYPVKHEVAVPAPYPVPHPIPVPQHVATSFTPVNIEDYVDLTTNNQAFVQTTGNGYTDNGQTKIVVSGPGMNGQIYSTGLGATGGGSTISVDVGTKEHPASFNIINSNGPSPNLIQVSKQQDFSVPVFMGLTAHGNQAQYAVNEPVDDLIPPAFMVNIPQRDTYSQYGGVQDYDGDSDENISSEVGNLEVPTFVTQQDQGNQKHIIQSQDSTGYRYRRRDKNAEKGGTSKKT